jgi:hypothetical protein
VRVPAPTSNHCMTALWHLASVTCRACQPIQCTPVAPAGRQPPVCKCLHLPFPLPAFWRINHSMLVLETGGNHTSCNLPALLLQALTTVDVITYLALVLHTSTRLAVAFPVSVVWCLPVPRLVGTAGRAWAAKCLPGAADLLWAVFWAMWIPTSPSTRLCLQLHNMLPAAGQSCMPCDHSAAHCCTPSMWHRSRPDS